MSNNRKPSQRPGSRFARLLRLLHVPHATRNPLAHDGRDESADHAWRTTVRRRAFVALAFVALWMTSVQARLVFLQVVKHDKYAADAARQQEAVLRPEAMRGDILDRNGRLLAYSVEADSIFADPKLVVDANGTAAAVCRALGDCTARERVELPKKLKGTGRFVYIRRSRLVSPEQVARVVDLDLPGIGFKSDTGRYYPLGSLAAHVIGFVNQDNSGQAGVEHAFETTIRGIDGLATAQVDARNRRLETRVDRAPVPGASLELTIDLNIQHIAEQALREGIAASKAQAGTAIVMNPHTGEILALVSYPTFNPNAVGRSKPDDRRNRATQDVYEPGSTFKVVTASAAIEEGVMRATDLIDTSPGRYSFPGRKAITESGGHNYGVLTFEDAIIKSSNIAAIKVGLRLGAERLTRYVHRFGFGQELAPDFPGQSRGIWNSSNLNDSGLASVSMGYQVSVTPLQMATAVSAVANGGLLMEPRIVRAVVRDGVREQVQPRIVRRAIEADTARVVRHMMEGVVERGTARTAMIEGYPAAGKTGTAHKVMETGGYSRSDYNASFVGFIPARDPQFTILVVIDTPRTSIYGGTVAAPVFRKIAEAALQQRGIAPVSGPVTAVAARAGRPMEPSTQQVRVSYVPTVVAAGGPMLMPDVRGLSARDALRVLGAVGQTPRMVGTGFVDTQMPLAGTPIDPGGVATIALQRTASASRADQGATP